MSKDSRTSLPKDTVLLKTSDADPNFEGVSSPTQEVTEHPLSHLLHELRVHQIELELQNQQLIEARNAAEESASSFSELYDFAPVGYVTLNLAGRITRSNLAAAQLLGVDRKHLIDKRLAAFVAQASLPKFNNLFSHSNTLSDEPVCEIVLVGKHPRTVQMDISVNNNKLEYRLVLTDVTEHKQMVDKLEEREFLLTEYQRVGLIGSYAIDLQAYTWDSSVVLDTIFGLDSNFIKTTENWIKLIHADDKAALINYFSQKLIGTKQVFNHKYRIIRPCDGITRWLQQRGEMGFDSSGKPLRILGIIQDITERQESELKLRLAASVFTHAQEGIMISDANGTILEVNDTFTDITGFKRIDAVGKSAVMLQSDHHSPAFYASIRQTLIEKGYWYGEVWKQRKSGEVYPEMQAISAVKDISGKPQHYVSLFTDITNLKAHQQQLEHAANFDALTNLPNRVLLADRLPIALLQCQRHSKKLAVVYIDLDGFKQINDTHGHDIGDQLLISISQSMTEALREGDTLARIGGDEFVAVLADLETPEDCKPVLDRLQKAAAETISLGDALLNVSASIGVAIYPESGNNADLLIRQADQAMYIAKESGKDRYHFFDINTALEAKNLSSNLDLVRRAFAQGEFVLHYQPKINMRTSQVLGVEALIRWRHPDKGLLEPGDFLPFIEEHPIRMKLGEWVINAALSQISIWHKQGLVLPVSVNVGAYQLQDKNFFKQLSTALKDNPRVQPGQLELEILETSALENVKQVSSLMSACEKIGVSFSLDDFGTGYSSLTYLKRLPSASLKIDQSFVQDMLTNPDDLAIVSGIISLAKVFNRNVIAEGVESSALAEKLLCMNCEIGQGYGIAQPMSAADLPLWVKNWHENPAWKA